MLWWGFGGCDQLIDVVCTLESPMFATVTLICFSVRYVTVQKMAVHPSSEGTLHCQNKKVRKWKLVANIAMLRWIIDRESIQDVLGETLVIELQ